MILEVNNTFDERRLYFLKRANESDSHDAQRSDSIVFRHSWPKDFHVSPFNSRNGSYTLVAYDPFQNKSSLRVDNTITLNSSKDHAKIVARL